MKQMTTINRVAVIGSGSMGRQIALQIARHGLSVTLYDIDDTMLTQAKSVQQTYVQEWFGAGTITAHESDTILERIQYATDLEVAVKDADLAIEAIPERVDLKRTVFAQLDRLMLPHAIIATNSSSIRVSLLEDVTERPELVANLHFYMPVWDAPMVEVGGGTQTDADVLDALTVFSKQIGILPLRVMKESTGFIFNRVWRAIKKEVLRVADSGVASFQDIDRAWIMKYGTQELPPFAHMDRIGLDVVKDIEEHYASESGDPADMPPPILTDKVARGDLGMKTGRGFYSYPNPEFAEPDFLKPDSA
jgi:3-hydroxybutyryl-CoA dehydrogenase